MESTAMGGVAGVEMKGRIPWIQDRQGQVGRALLGAHQKLNLTVGIDGHPETFTTPVSDGLAEGCCRSLQAIGSTDGLVDGLGHRCQDTSRRGEVGGAQ